MANKTRQTSFPPQHQEQQPGIQSQMKPEPVSEDVQPYLKLKDKVALITGGDSGIGRAVAALFAQHGAKIVIAYLNEHDDAACTKELVEQHGQPCETIAGDLVSPTFCRELVEQTVKRFGKIDLLINNAGEHTPQTDLEDITPPAAGAHIQD